MLFYSSLSVLGLIATPLLAAPVAQSPNGVVPTSYRKTASTQPTTLASISNNTASVNFFSCPSTVTAGAVHNVTVTPCERDATDEPCRFSFGKNYTIDINYTSYLNADMPRNSLEARDDDVLPSLRYPYSGQSFGGCGYTSCPIVSGQDSVYTYIFETLKSPFNYLMFNLSQSLDGPSLFCAGFQAQYISTEDSSSTS